MAANDPSTRLPRSSPPLEVVRLLVVDATRERLEGYATFIGTDVDNGGLPIPFYRGSIVEGHTLPFVCPEEVVVRTAQVRPRAGEVTWLERHLRMTQLFVGLGGAPFAMVLGKPTHLGRGEASPGIRARAPSSGAPDLESLALFRFPPGHGLILAAGTWHDFPMAVPGAGPVTVLTMSSSEIVAALASVESASELAQGDVLKVDVARTLGVRLLADLPAPDRSRP